MYLIIDFQSFDGSRPINDFRVSVRRSGDLSGIRAINNAIDRLERIGLGLLNTAMMDNIEDDIYELRARHYRVFCYYDRGQAQFILLNGFRKRTQRTPLREIALARRLVAEYRTIGGG